MLQIGRIGKRVLLVAAAVLVLSPVAPVEAGDSVSWAARLWSWLSSGMPAYPQGGRIVSATGASDKGSSIDPDGGDRPSSATGQSDVGPAIDPLGQPR